MIHITCVNADREAHHGETEPLAYSGDLELRDIPSWCGLLNQTEVSSAMASGPIKVVPIACLTIAVSIAMGQVSFAQNLGPRTEATSCATAIRGNATFGTISLVCSVPPEVLDALVKSRTQDLDGLASAHKDTKLDRARMQTNLGNALAMLSEREADTAKFEEAVAAYREALKEQTRERAPLDWAISTGDLGITSMQLAQRKRDAAMAQTAVVQIKAARDALTAGRYLSAGYYETQLKIADSIAEQLKGR